MSNKDLYIRSSSAEFLIFEQQKKEKGIEVRFEDGDLWLTQKALGELYNTSKQDISYHLSNIFKELELEQNSVVKNYLTTASDGKKYKTNYYNLDAVISVGYRVNTDRAIQFRRWATNVLKEFSKKGYIIDKKRMENGTFFDEDYFESLLAEIREIRLSERRFYQKITDIYATSIDYDSKSPTTIKFFKKVQNKMHYAVTHQTAAEIIYNRADHTKEHMNLTRLEKQDEIKKYEFKLFDGNTEQIELSSGFENAITFGENGKCISNIAYCAYCNGNIIGVAGADKINEDIWEVGIEVLPEYRKDGLATILTKNLTMKILEKGIVPIWCASSTNIGSQAVANRSCYIPLWVESFGDIFDDGFVYKDLLK